MTVFKNKYKIRSIIFDMNGVIVNDEPLHKLAFQNVFGDLGFSLNNKEYDEYFLGRTDKDGFKIAFAQKKIVADLDRCLENKSYYYQTLAEKKMRPFPGILNFINQAYKRFILALASSSSDKEIETVLTTFKIKKKFKVIVSNEDVQQGKPDPEIFLVAAKRLDVPPESCIVIEDSKMGILAAKTARMKCLAVANTHPVKELQDADIVINSFEKIDLDWLISEIKN